MKNKHFWKFFIKLLVFEYRLLYYWTLLDFELFKVINLSWPPTEAILTQTPTMGKKRANERTAPFHHLKLTSLVDCRAAGHLSDKELFLNDLIGTGKWKWVHPHGSCAKSFHRGVRYLYCAFQYCWKHGTDIEMDDCLELLEWVSWRGSL